MPSCEPADSDTRRVIGMMMKLLHRGATPPLHPDSERRLLIELGYEDRLAPSPPGDVAPCLRRPMSVPATSAIPDTSGAALSTALFDSDAEQDFVALMGSEYPDLAPWLAPQIPFDKLLKSHHIPSDACRRCDFLLALPGRQSIVIEIDGSQHAEQVLTDAERDRLLNSIGVETIRISTAELSEASGAGLRRLADIAAGFTDITSVEPLVWVPVQVHRLVLALLEALSAGFLRGVRWVVELDDPTTRAASLIGPYLEMLDALDQLWGGHGVAPDRLVFVTSEGAREFARSDEGAYMESWLDSAPPADVKIALESGRTPIHELPAATAVPAIVVRTCSLPVVVSDPPIGGTTRIKVRSERSSTARALRTILRGVFAKEDFKQGQLDGVLEVLEGRDCVVLLPTGAGKSLIYQLAGLCLPGRTVIVDPLVALIEDQVEGLASHGIDRVVGVTGQSTRGEAGAAILQRVADADAYFVFIAPQRLQMQSFRTALRELATTAPVNLAVIDEAHCVSEWGHQFVTAYLNLGRVIRSTCLDTNGVPPPLLALTGTASRAVLRDVLFQLGIEERSENTIVRPKSFDRPELHYRVVRVDERDAEASLRGVLKSLPEDFNETSQTFFDPDHERTFSGLVFVPTVNGRHGIISTANAVEPVSGRPGIFSGSAPKGEPSDSWERTKRTHASSFKRNLTPVLVTTNAFGMGIDKKNIRWVVHYGLPGSIEGYYQEVGRAGRDERDASCVLLLSQFDVERNRQLLAEDLSLEQARERQGSIPRNATDVVTTALYFHVNSFPGVDSEVVTLLAMVDLIGPTEEMKQIEIPFGHDQDASERALHRLVMLGVVSDYLVEWGSKKFTVFTAKATTRSVVESLLELVDRSNPQRRDGIREEIDRRYVTLRDAIEASGRAMVQFVYDTIERSRRRSLREMWLTAVESANGDELRQRVLDYLAEGDVMPLLERLLDNEQFRFHDWIDSWSMIMGAVDAREWRAASARLLGSYPDHPGLLATRGIVESFDPTGESRELELNVASALRTARDRYGVDGDAIDDVLLWMLDHLPKDPRPVQASVLGAARLANYDSASLQGWLDQADHADPELAILLLARQLDDAVELIDFAIERFQEV